MANYTEEQWNARKNELMEKCYNGFADLGLHGTGIRALANHCGYNASMIYTYFEDLDDLIIQSTEYCMSKVEDDFMALHRAKILGVRIRPQPCDNHGIVP